jgi:hypothetical protein
MGNNGTKAPSSARPPLSLWTVICAATIDDFACASKEWPKMPRHLCPCHHHHCRRALPFALLPDCNCARGQGTDDNAKAPLSTPSLPCFVVMHHCSCGCHDRHRARGQGMANNAKALLSAQPPLLSLRSVVCTPAIVAIVQEGKEQPTIPPWYCLPLCRHHCRQVGGQGTANDGSKAPSSALPPLSLRTIIHAAVIDAVAGASKEQLMMPRHCCPCCCHLHHRAPWYKPS